MITYALYKNKLTNGNGYYRASVKPARTYGLEEVIDRMLQHGSTLTKQDMMAVLDEFFETVKLLVLEGNNVVTPVANFSVSIRGNFESNDDSFEASRHQVEPIVNPNQAYRRLVQGRAQVQQQAASRPMPQPEQYLNPNNGAGPERLIPGGGAILRGHKLQFDPDDREQGIFLANGNGRAIRAEVILRNTGRELSFLVPAQLKPGDYSVEVRARYGTENLRSGRLEQTLTVK